MAAAGETLQRFGAGWRLLLNRTVSPLVVRPLPALHYFAILYMVHLEAKRLKLAGMPADEIPHLGRVMKSSWHLFIPLVVMVTLLLMQYTPFLAAFWCITLTVACSWIPRLLGRHGQ